MPVFYIGDGQLHINTISEITTGNYVIALSEKAIERIKKCRTYLDDKLALNNEPVYGINTGFGYLQNVKVEQENLTKLQHYLLLSHACGTGDEVPKEMARKTM